MLISQKCQYALRAIFELAKRDKDAPVSGADIAQAQAIPQRFLEVILTQLKQGGFVASQRGAKGGYVLIRPPKSLRVGEVIAFVQGPIGPVHCLVDSATSDCPFLGDCVFMPMWEEAGKAMAAVFDRMSFADLVSKDRARPGKRVMTYTI